MSDRIFEPSDCAFAVGGVQAGGMMTEIFILERSLVEARDPRGLTPINASRMLGKPDKLVLGQSGNMLSAYYGTGEQARKALKEAGFLEAPVVFQKDLKMAYVDRFDTETKGLRPVERILHVWQGDNLVFIGRFPSEPDRYVERHELPKMVQNCLPPYSPQTGIAFVQHKEPFAKWLVDVAKVPLAEAQ